MEYTQKELSLDEIQTIQNRLHDLYQSHSQDKEPVVFYAGLLAWEATRLFWYATRGDWVGVSDKFGMVIEAVEKLRRAWVKTFGSD